MNFKYLAIKKQYRLPIYIALAFIGILFLIFSTGFHDEGQNQSMNDESNSINNPQTQVGQTENNNTINEEDTVPKENEEDKIKPITGLVIGLDKSKALTDVIMIAHFDPETNKVKLISIPRDLYIDFEDPMFAEVKKNNDHLKISHCKITEVYGNAGENKEAIKSIQQIASSIIGMPIEYYAVIDLDAFKSLVDLVDGVEVTIPYNMNYEDPLQNLYIHLQKGTQVLDGKHAEMLVRYRGGPENDFGRIKMQQMVLKELSKKILGIRDFSKFIGLINNINKYIETDFNLFDGMKYSKYAFDLNLHDLLTEENMITLPTESKRLDYWYEILKKEETQEMVSKLLEDKE